MLTTRFVVGVLSLGLLVVGADVVSGQNYPNRPIRIVTSNVGGGSDIATRLFTADLAANLGQSVVVENRATVIPPEIVAKAQPDGYTLLVDGSSFWVAPLLQKMPYDFAREFTPITPLSIAPNVLVVHPTLGANSIKELIALAKAKPGVLNYGSSATGSSNHLTAEMFNAMTGVNIVRVPYKGTSLFLTALAGGEVQLAFANASATVPWLKSGKLKALAVTSAQPSTLVPGVPTMAASGLPGYEAVSMDGVFAPAGMPIKLIHFLNQEIVRVVNSAEVKERYFKAGVEVYTRTAEQFAAEIKSDITKWGKVIKDAGIKVN